MKNNRLHSAFPRYLLTTLSLAAGGTFLVDSVEAFDESPVTKINTEAARAVVQTQALRGNVSVLTGSGGNIGVLARPSGKLMVDAGLAVSHDKIATALAQLGPTPVKYVINTHWHWDHTDGNAWLHEAGGTIIGHPNTLVRLSEAVRVNDWDHTFEPAPKAARPTIVVSRDKTLQFDDETVRIGAYTAGHTDTDLFVYFAKADILMTGDTFWNDAYPFLDYDSGGGIDSAIRAANKNLELAKAHTIVVPGHGSVGTRDDLVAFRDMLVDVRDKVAAMKTRGMSVEQVVAAKPTDVHDKRWGGFVIAPDFFARLVYKGL